MPDSRRRSWRAALDDFLFQPVDAVAAAWLRIAFALALPIFFRPQPFITSQGVPTSITWIPDHVLLTHGYWLAAVAVCALLAAGWRARTTATILVLMLLPLNFLFIARPSWQVMLSALLAFSFVRSDAVRLPWRVTAAERSRTAGPAWPIRLIQLLLTVLYGANAIAKSRPAYLSGDALMDMSVALPNFRADFSDGALDVAGLAIPVAVAAVVSALVEYFLALGFWLEKWKWVVAACGVAFHFGLTYIVRIYMLDYAAIFLYLAFLLPLIREDESRLFQQKQATA